MTQFVDEKTNSDKELEIALILFLVIATGVRAGSTIGKHQEEGVGICTLKRKNLRIDGNELQLQFKGKGGVISVESIESLAEKLLVAAFEDKSCMVDL